MSAHEFVAQMPESDLIHVLQASMLSLTHDGCLDQMDLSDAAAEDLHREIEEFMSRNEPLIR